MVDNNGRSRRRRGSLRDWDGALLQPPTLAWPTVALAVAALGLWCKSLRHLLLLIESTTTNHQQELTCFLLSTVAAYFCFTPVHDACHRAVAASLGRRSLAAAVNDLVGRIASLPLLVPFPAFRHVHLLHHKHTNDPIRDPDHYTQGGWWHCLKLEQHYYRFIYRNWSDVPTAVLCETAIVLVATYSCVAAGIHLWGLRPFLLGVVLPQRVATLYLAWCFDCAPHRGAVDRQTDEYRTTKRICGFFSCSSSSLEDAVDGGGAGGCTTRASSMMYYSGRVAAFLLRVALTEQDAHVVHHLYPWVPFYKYHTIWNRHEKELYERGVENTALFWPS